MNQLKAFVQLGGAQAGITVTDEAYGGTTITVVDLSGLGGMVDSMSDGAVQAPSDIKLAYAVTDKVVVIGYGTAFVKGVLDAQAGDSLATTDRFSTALTQAGTEHASLLWVDITAVRGAVEDLVPADALGRYDADVQPYLEALDSMISVASPGRQGRPRNRHHPGDRRLTEPIGHRPAPSQSPRMRVPPKAPPIGGALHHMAVRIRLTRVGATKQPTYRLVVADSRSARDGRAIDTIGHYNPRTEPIELVVDEAKAKEWMAKGAQPSDTVRRLFKQAGVLPGAK